MDSDRDVLVPCVPSLQIHEDPPRRYELSKDERRSKQQANQFRLTAKCATIQDVMQRSHTRARLDIFNLFLPQLKQTDASESACYVKHCVSSVCKSTTLPVCLRRRDCCSDGVLIVSSSLVSTTLGSLLSNNLSRYTSMFERMKERRRLLQESTR